MTFRITTKYCAALSLILLVCAQSVFAASRLAARTKSSGNTWIIFVGVLGIFGVIVGIGFYLDKVRSDKIAAFAGSLGLTYRSKPTPSDLSLPSGCHLMGIGHGHTIRNILEAVQTPELGFTLFDLQYTVGSGRNSSTYQQTVSRMQSSLLCLPSFILFPETIFSKLGETIMGRKDIDFSDSPVFSEAFVLRGDDDTAIRALFAAKLRHLLEATPDLTVEGNADHLFIFRAGHRLKPEEFSATIEEDKKILALFFEAQEASVAAES